MKRLCPTLLSLLLCTLLGSLLLSACGGVADLTQTQPPAASDSDTGVTVVDALGNTVQLSQAPQRIVVAGRGIFMVVDALYTFPQTKERLIALASGGQITNGFLDLLDPTLGEKSTLQSDAGPEQIAAANPDVVVLKSYMAEALGKPLAELDIPVVYVDFETPEGYQRDLSTLGQLFQDPARAQQVKDFYQSRVDRISAALDGLAEEKKPRVLLLYYNSRDGEVAFNVPPTSWMQTMLVEMAGGRPVWTQAQLGNSWNKISFDQIAAWDADQIYVTAYFDDTEQVVAQLQADAQWQELRAVQAGHLYAFPGDFYSWDQPDTRWVLGLTWLAVQLHPARLPDLDIMAETRAFYEQLYGLDQGAYQQIIERLTGDLP